MAVVAKKRKRGTTYYVVTWFANRAWSERSGTDKREAERLDARRKSEVKKGTFDPELVAPKAAQPKTVAEYAEEWISKRTNISASDDARNVRRYLKLPWFAGMQLDDLRPKHIIKATKEVKASVPSVKTAKNAYGSLRTMFREAHIDEAVGRDPCVLPKNFFKDGAAIERTPYEREEAAKLVSPEKISYGIHVLNALCLLGGLREGEACGRRWRDLDRKVGPLWALEVRDQYGGRALKTRNVRIVPVHPELQLILEHWEKNGFVELMGRAPEPDDFIVPHPSARVRAGGHTRSTYYKAFRAACEAVGVANRSLHSTRHTMITMARRGGARKDVLQLVTHNAKGDIVDRYTHMDWEPLCVAVLAIGSLFAARPSPRRPAEIPQESASTSDADGPPIPAELPECALSSRLQFPAPPLARQQKPSLSDEPRQSPRQRESAGIGGPLLAARVPPDKPVTPGAWALALAAEVAFGRARRRGPVVLPATAGGAP